jgi:hypothetical protein
MSNPPNHQSTDREILNKAKDKILKEARLMAFRIKSLRDKNRSPRSK